MLDVNAGPLAPIEDSEQITVGDGELFAQQVGMLFQMCSHVVEAFGKILPGRSLGLFRCRRIEQRAEPLMNLRVDVRQPFLQAIAGERTVLRGKTCFWLEIGDVLDDCRAFAQAGAVVEFEDGYVALRIDSGEVATVGRQRVRFEIDTDKFKIETRLAQGDVG